MNVIIEIVCQLCKFNGMLFRRKEANTETIKDPFKNIEKNQLSCMCAYGIECEFTTLCIICIIYIQSIYACT